MVVSDFKQEKIKQLNLGFPLLTKVCDPLISFQVPLISVISLDKSRDQNLCVVNVSENCSAIGLTSFFK